MPYTDETLLRDYEKLEQSNKSKAEKYIKNLLRLQKADKDLSKAKADVEKELRKAEPYTEKGDPHESKISRNNRCH